ncbi:MAG: hypothetical protein M1820_008317 [Bogoriella megaspora]|nr:MAG: hypothetical protein M1820_008317 [Bogoriella megaspora]
MPSRHSCAPHWCRRIKHSAQTTYHRIVKNIRDESPVTTLRQAMHIQAAESEARAARLGSNTQEYRETLRDRPISEVYKKHPELDPSVRWHRQGIARLAEPPALLVPDKTWTDEWYEEAVKKRKERRVIRFDESARPMCMGWERGKCRCGRYRDRFLALNGETENV